jgi:hypothetical protein
MLLIVLRYHKDPSTTRSQEQQEAKHCNEHDPTMT